MQAPHEVGCCAAEAANRHLVKIQGSSWDMGGLARLAVNLSLPTESTPQEGPCDSDASGNEVNNLETHPPSESISLPAGRNRERQN